MSEQDQPRTRPSSQPSTEVYQLLGYREVSVGSHEHQELQCAAAMRSAHAFLHGELPEWAADDIRAHLMACEDCMDNFDVESFITALVRRCTAQQPAPQGLRARIVSMHVTYHSGQ